MIDFFIGDKQVNIQFIPIYGCSLGVIYYNPNLEPDSDPVDDDDYYDQITIMLVFFGIHITIF